MRWKMIKVRDKKKSFFAFIRYIMETLSKALREITEEN